MRNPETNEESSDFCLIAEDLLRKQIEINTQLQDELRRVDRLIAKQTGNIVKWRINRRQYDTTGEN